MRTFGRLLAAVACASVLALPLVAPNASAAPSNRPDPNWSEARIHTLADLDALIAEQSEAPWQWLAASDVQGLDAAGRRFADYVAEDIYTPAVAAELQALRTTAGTQSARGDAAGLQAALAQASRISSRQLAQIAVLLMHFGTSQGFAAHEAALAPLLQRTSEQDRKRIRERIDPQVAAIRASMLAELRSPDLVAHLETTPPDTGPVMALVAIYGEERSALAASLAQLDDLEGRPLMRLDVPDACVPPYPQSSGSATPTIVPDHSTYPEYPLDARRLGIEGTVTLRARVSAKGCVETIEVTGPLGYEPLDRSALAWGSTQRFHPASEQGRAVPGVVQFAVTFKLTD